MTTLAVDVSYFQRPIDGSYPHDVFICRHSDGDFVDPNFATNWSRALANPRIAVLVAYHVYRPASDVAQARRADRVRADTGGIGCAMIDAETWGGQISGNQSTGLNALRQLLTARFGSNPRRVFGYANRGDWGSMWPARPGDLPMMVAAYSSQMPTWTSQMVGWQYSDGQAQWPVPAGLPRSSDPFGPCDHNVFPGFPSGAALAAWIGGGGLTGQIHHAIPIELDEEEDDMPYSVQVPVGSRDLMFRVPTGINRVSINHDGPAQAVRVRTGVVTSAGTFSKGPDAPWRSTAAAVGPDATEVNAHALNDVDLTGRNALFVSHYGPATAKLSDGRTLTLTFWKS